MRASLVLLVLAACEAVPPAGLLPALAPPAPPAPPRDALDEAIDAAKAEGLVVPPAPAPAPEPAPPVVAPVAGPAVVPLPAAPVALTLVGVLPDTTPPRALLALPDGTELVVRPGAWIAPAHAVVLAVDATGVELARVVAEGPGAVMRPERLGPPAPPAP